jgi:hypothetical protein
VREPHDEKIRGSTPGCTYYDFNFFFEQTAEMSFFGSIERETMEALQVTACLCCKLSLHDAS